MLYKLKKIPDMIQKLMRITGLFSKSQVAILQIIEKIEALHARANVLV